MIEIDIQYPHKDWNWSSFSPFSTFPMNFVVNHPALNWNYYKLSRHPYLNSELILMNPTKSWHWNSLLTNSNITLSFMLKNSHLPWKTATNDYETFDTLFLASIEQRKIEYELKRMTYTIIMFIHYIIKLENQYNNIYYYFQMNISSHIY